MNWKRYSPPLPTKLLLLAGVFLLTVPFYSGQAFQLPSSPVSIRHRRKSPPPMIAVWSTKKEDSTSTSQKEEEEGLSETDARVLQSMLQDKLDLKTERDLKKLLERGVVSKEVPTTEKPAPKAEGGDQFSSQMLKTFTDTTLWQTLERKANDWLESAKLNVQNQLERSAVTIAALGMFAWERAVRDVARALPASSTFLNNTKKEEDTKSLLLSEKSSFEEMTTPLDELKSVGSSVVEIFRTGGTTDMPAGSGSGVLKSAATSRQDKRNFQRSYESTQKRASTPVVKQAASGMTDTAWQLKRELQVESNAPGYRTQEFQRRLQAASNSTRQLLAGAQESWKLERARAQELLKQAQEEEEVVEVMGTEEGAKFASENAAKFVDAVDVTATPTESQQPSAKETTQPQQQLSQREIEAQRRQERQQAEQQQQEVLRRQQHALYRQEIAQQIASQFQAVCLELQTELQNCIANPEQTWLTEEIVFQARRQSGEEFDQAKIRNVVTEMIAIRNALKELAKREVVITELGPPLDDTQRQVAELQASAQEAVSPAAAQALQTLLAESVALEELQSQVLAFVEEEEPIQSSEQEGAVFFASTTNAVVEEPTQQEVVTAVESDDTISVETASPVEPEIVDVIPEAFVYTVATTPTTSTTKSSSSAAQVDVVTDDDFEAAVGEWEATKQAAVADTSAEKEVAKAAKKEEENVVITFLLRVLDIMFFLLEKTFTVVLPAVLTGSGTAKDRLDEVARGGLGSEGWKRIGNAKEGAQRY